jgi:hypothetical protein
MEPGLWMLFSIALLLMAAAVGVAYLSDWCRKQDDADHKPGPNQGRRFDD